MPYGGIFLVNILRKLKNTPIFAKDLLHFHVHPYFIFL